MSHNSPAAQRYAPSAVLFTARIYLACSYSMLMLCRGATMVDTMGVGTVAEAMVRSSCPALLTAMREQRFISLRMSQGILAFALSLPSQAAAFAAKPV